LLTISFPSIAKGRDGGKPVLFGLGEEDKDRSRSLRDDNKKGDSKSDSNTNSNSDSNSKSDSNSSSNSNRNSNSNSDRKCKSQMRGSSMRSE
jgi:hypothetical protein